MTAGPVEMVVSMVLVEVLRAPEDLQTVGMEASPVSLLVLVLVPVAVEVVDLEIVTGPPQILEVGGGSGAAGGVIIMYTLTTPTVFNNLTVQVPVQTCIPASPVLMSTGVVALRSASGTQAFDSSLGASSAVQSLATLDADVLQETGFSVSAPFSGILSNLFATYQLSVASTTNSSALLSIGISVRRNIGPPPAAPFGDTGLGRNIVFAATLAPGLQGQSGSDTAGFYKVNAGDRLTVQTQLTVSGTGTFNGTIAASFGWRFTPST